MKPIVHLAVPVLLRNDAVGNDVLGMARALRQHGYTVGVFTEHVQTDHDCRPSRVDLSDRVWQNKHAILIYHHSTGWPLGEQLLLQTQNRKVVKYHNVTPPHFFQPHSNPHAASCTEGVTATKRISRLDTTTFWGDSTFNTRELISWGAPPARCHTLAPFHQVADLQEAATTTNTPFYQQLEQNTAILFTGGIKPNKCHELIIESFAHYHYRKNRNSVLVLVGPAEKSLNWYLQHLQALVTDLSLEQSVIFTGPVDQGCLKTCYQLADVFLCASAHEGFCVPLIEAMSFRLPIVTCSGTALPETIGDAGLVFSDRDPRVYAEAIDFVVENRDVAAEMCRRGEKRFWECFAIDVLSRQFEQLLGEVPEQ